MAPDSQVETFAALRLEIDSWRWQGRALLHPRREVPAGDVHGDRRPAAPASDDVPRASISSRTTCGFGSVRTSRSPSA